MDIVEFYVGSLCGEFVYNVYVCDYISIFDSDYVIGQNIMVNDYTISIVL
jgi:hypothetical protein